MNIRYKIQIPGNHPKERIKQNVYCITCPTIPLQFTDHGRSTESFIWYIVIKRTPRIIILNVVNTKQNSVNIYCRLRLKFDGTRAETRFRLSAKRTSPFKSAGGRQFSRLPAAEVCASAVVMLDTPCSEVVWKVLATGSWGVHISGSNAG